MHFTYDKIDPLTLTQGDLLKRTDEITNLLTLVHPHYGTQAEYRYLMVLTQACDLERRAADGLRCKARYITLAAVRPLTTALSREVNNLRQTPAEVKARIADEGRRNHLQQFVERLLNNNEASYFYLHPALELGLDAPCCAFLRLSIAVRSADHYDTCLAAKFLQLKPEFQAKLGWLVGNMYWRVGTADWVPAAEPEREFRDRVKELVDSTAVWVDKKIYPRLVKALEQGGSEITPDLVSQKIAELRLPSRREAFLTRLREVLPDLGLDQAAVDPAINRIRSDPVLSQHLRD